MCLAVPGEVIEFDASIAELPTALVEFGGIRRRVCMACVPDAKPGEFVIVHAGIAISRIDPHEARHVFAYLNEIGESDGWGGDAAAGAASRAAESSPARLAGSTDTEP
jgi:hydrogenase expression/formation protein HypC